MKCVCVQKEEEEGGGKKKIRKGHLTGIARNHSYEALNLQIIIWSCITRIVYFTLGSPLLPLSESARDYGVRNLSPVTT